MAALILHGAASVLAPRRCIDKYVRERDWCSESAMGAAIPCVRSLRDGVFAVHVRVNGSGRPARVTACAVLCQGRDVVW